jgi:hypothetical protein
MENVEITKEEHERLTRIEKIVVHALAQQAQQSQHSQGSSQPGVFFICGTQGPEDENGLPEKILVCPGSGLDGFAVYSKTSGFSAPSY